MNSAAKLMDKLLNVILGSLLIVMSILVFGNVVMRYVFNSGITWSEEISRYMFIYLVFLGAIGALKDNLHLGVNMVIKRFPANLKRVVYIVSNLLVLFTLWLLFHGSWNLTLQNTKTQSPVTELPMSFVFAIGVIVSVCMAVIILYNIFRVLKNKHIVHELTELPESEETVPPGVTDADDSCYSAPDANRNAASPKSGGERQ